MDEVPVSAPRIMRMHTLRRLQRRLDRALDEAGNQQVSAVRRRELHQLSLELQRELARLEQMPWPSGRVFARGDSRPLERRLLPLLRALRAEPAPTPVRVVARYPAQRARV
ncbi:MAG: hypothetical protein ABI317_14395 [Gaiellales bacterium]